MGLRKILIQLDTDPHASSFDRVVAIDSGVDELFSYANVEPADVEGLVHGAMFTRGPADLKNTAFFIGGKNVLRAEELLAAVARTYFGPLRCSVLLDANGANTTAAAAVLAACRHLEISLVRAVVLAGTGPVGLRVALLLAKLGATVFVGSRSKDRAADACESIQQRFPDAGLFPIGVPDSHALAKLQGPIHLIISAGAAGARLALREHLAHHRELKVVVDLNAVPPSGIEGVEPGDKGKEVDGVFQYGAIGVGGLKMKIHRAAIGRLFEANDQILDAEEVFAIGQRLESAR